MHIESIIIGFDNKYQQKSSKKYTLLIHNCSQFFFLFFFFNNQMINRIMANVDVKLGIKHILERIEQAYSKRSPVRANKICAIDLLLISFRLPINVHIFLFFNCLKTGYSNRKTIIGGCEQNKTDWNDCRCIFGWSKTFWRKLCKGTMGEEHKWNH